ncbi:MAG: precorrin-2 C(20)-methyltransferase [Alphaproteobacteria bacterium]
MNIPTLYGIGVGPGDPDLITLKAHRLITNAAHIAYFAPTGGGSFARSIVADYIPKTAHELQFEVPMVSGRAPAQSIYDEAARRIHHCLDQGEDVILLCEGDPLTYGSFIYILSRMRKTHPVEIVAGISAIQACAASAGFALASRNEIFQIVPAPLGDQHIMDALDHGDSFAIIKLGRHLPRLRALLKAKGLEDNTHYIAHVGLDRQICCALRDAPAQAPYFSMLLIYKGQEPWR